MAIQAVKDSGGTWLHDTLIHGTAGDVMTLIYLGEPVDSLNSRGQTPLHVSIMYKRISSALEIALRSNSLHHRDFRGNTALHYALNRKQSWRQFNELRAVLIELGHDLDSKNNAGQTPLHIAIIKGHTQAANLLIKKEWMRGTSVGIETPDRDGNTPLHLATMHRRFEVIEILLDCEANAEIKNRKGQTPFDLVKCK